MPLLELYWKIQHEVKRTFWLTCGMVVNLLIIMGVGHSNCSIFSNLSFDKVMFKILMAEVKAS